MTYCNNCGSASVDKDGFCGGCGARVAKATMETSVEKAATPGSAQAAAPQVGTGAGQSRSAKPALYLPAIDFVQPTTKNLWIAILLTTFLGPLGLLYCTFPGAIVMFIVSIAVRFFFGGYLALLVWPLCALWAWRAVRSGSDGWSL